jgi:hypothetical protein
MIILAAPVKPKVGDYLFYLSSPGVSTKTRLTFVGTKNVSDVSYEELHKGGGTIGTVENTGWPLSDLAPIREFEGSNSWVLSKLLKAHDVEFSFDAMLPTGNLEPQIPNLVQAQSVAQAINKLYKSVGYQLFTRQRGKTASKDWGVILTLGKDYVQKHIAGLAKDCLRYSIIGYSKKKEQNGN